MPSRTIIKKATFLIFLMVASGGVLLKPASAQTISSPTFLITWETTGSYIPSFYQGKALPTYGSIITASFELVSSQGKILDISGQTIYWYLNDTLVGGGIGVQQVAFPPLGDAPNTMNLRITIPNYNGATLVQAINIPMVLPRAVIYAPYPNGQFSQNPLTIQALPYFFNISNPSTLAYSWSVNDQSGSNAENPQEAQISLPKGTPSGTSLAVSLNIENPGDSTIGTASANLTLENQL